MGKKRTFKKNSVYDLLRKGADENGGVCVKCGKHTDNLTVDHIVPYQLIFDLGLRDVQYDHDWNFQLLCRACNRLKGGGFDFTDARTVPNLRKYVDLAAEFYKQ